MLEGTSHGVCGMKKPAATKNLSFLSRHFSMAPRAPVAVNPSVKLAGSPSS